MGGSVLTQRRRGAECAKKAWPMVRIGDVGTITRGSGIKRSETVERGRPCLRYGEIYTSFNVILDKPKSFVPQEVFDRSVHIKHGDLVFTLTGENTEEIAKTLAYLGDEEIAAGGDLAVWANHGYDPMYLAYLMYSPALIKAKADASNGQIIVHASVRKIQDIQIPIPPLSVQREIVARLEKELGEADALAAKFKEIAENADAEFKAELDETFKNVEGEKVRLGDVCDVLAGYPFKGNSFASTGIKICGGLIISPTEIKWNECKHWESSEGLEDYLLAANDIVMALDRPWIADGFKIGMIEESDLPCLLIQRTARLRAKSIDSKYLLYLLRYPTFKEYCTFSGTTVPHISHKDIERFIISYPPLPVQRAIVARLDASKERCEKLKAAAERGLRAAEDLRKAILAEAFEQ